MNEHFLSDNERERYDRQLIFPQWGITAQKKLKDACVFIAGVGGLGSPVCMYLASVGVGRLRICDYDTVTRSNLNRQIVHDEKKIGHMKVRSAHERLKRLNPDIMIEPLSKKITPATLPELVGESSILVDCLDNFAARYVLNDYAISRRIPYVYGAVEGFAGYLSFMLAPETPCVQCLFPVPPEAGLFPVVGVTPGVIGSLQAMEVIKYITGIGEPAKGVLINFNGEESIFTRIPIKRNPGCAACSKTA